MQENDQVATGKPSAVEVARLGIEIASEEMRRRGASVRPAGAGYSRNWLTVHIGRRQPVHVYVKTRRVGTWHSRTRDEPSDINDASSNEYWLFVDLLSGPPDFYVVPAGWMENNIHRVHQDYLAKHGGTRPRTPASTHHGIIQSRIARWRDRWDLLGLPSKAG
jgi:hypothetical protein